MSEITISLQVVPSAYFVSFRVISWIASYAVEKADPRIHTKQHEQSHPRHIRVLNTVMAQILGRISKFR